MVTPRSNPPADHHGPPRNHHSPWRIRPGVWITGVLLIAIAATAWALTRPETPAPDQAGTPLDQTADLSDLLVDAPAALERAPDFAIPSRAGGDFILSSHLETDGRPVFLNLWASWCLPCRAEMPAIDEAAVRHPDVSFIGVAVQDDETEARAFADEIGVTYTIAFDIRDQVSALYPALGLPATFLIDADGNIVDTYIGTLDADVIDDLVSQF